MRVKEGWFASHPLTGEITEVIPAEYVRRIEQENEELRARLARYHPRACSPLNVRDIEKRRQFKRFKRD